MADRSIGTPGQTTTRREQSTSVIEQWSSCRQRASVVQPLRLRALLEGDVYATAEAADQSDDGLRFGRDRRSHRHRPLRVAHAHHQGCLMDVESHILNRLLFHGSRSFPAPAVRRLHGSRRERAFAMR